VKVEATIFCLLLSSKTLSWFWHRLICCVICCILLLKTHVYFSKRTGGQKSVSVCV
jgi:hypothetical protein